MGRYIADQPVFIRWKGRGSTDAQFTMGSPPFPDIVFIDYHKPDRTLRVKDKYGSLLRRIHIPTTRTDRGTTIPTINGDIKACYDPANAAVKVLVEYDVPDPNVAERDQYLIDTGVRFVPE